MQTLKKLKRVVIKEELVALTGDFRSAILLNQFIYWSERTADAAKFLKEERKRIEVYSPSLDKDFEMEVLDSLDLHQGWIYKKAEELSEECMVGFSKATIRRYLKTLVENKWLFERNNPKYNWDKTKQFRVNFVKIQEDLLKLGYSLEGYDLGGVRITDKEDITPIQNQNDSSEFNFETPRIQNDFISNKNETVNNISETAIPEIITETITETIYKGEERILETNKPIPPSPSDTHINNKKGVFPSLDFISKPVLTRLELEQKYLGLDCVSDSKLYSLFIDACIKTLEKDEVDIIKFSQYPYLTKTLDGMLADEKKKLERLRKEKLEEELMYDNRFDNNFI